jgi:hypothetical protein
MIGWQMISYYTARTPYEEEVKKLVASAAGLNVPLKIYACPPTGTWRGNLNHKSATILKAFEEFPDKDIVFVDADAIIRRWPALFDELSAKAIYDVSACFFSYTKRSGDKDELLSGTLWFRNAEVGRALVRRWHEIGLERREVRHQYCLKLAIQDLQRGGVPVRVFRHPFAYTCIFDYREARKGVAAVIEHYQASRRLRRVVGFGPPLVLKSGPDKASPPASAGRMRERNLDILRKHLEGKEAL